jgi:protease I
VSVGRLGHGYRAPMADQTPDLTGRTVAIIAVDFVEDAELTTPRDRLQEAGADVKVYSPDGSPIQAAEGDTDPTRKIDADGTFDDVDVETIDALVVPGGTVNADKLRIDTNAQSLARQVAGSGKPLAVICHGPWLLVSAGLVEGRRLTSYHSLADDIRNAGGSWVDEEVVVDRNLITSRNPGDLDAFVGALTGALAG